MVERHDQKLSNQNNRENLEHWEYLGNTQTHKPDSNRRHGDDRDSRGT